MRGWQIFVVLFLLSLGSASVEAARCRWENMMVLYKCTYDLGMLRGEKDAPKLAEEEFFDWFKRLTPKKLGERPALLIEFKKRGTSVASYQLASWKVLEAIPESAERNPASEVMRNQAKYRALVSKNLEKL